MAVITEQAFLDLLTEIQHHSRTMVYVPPSEPSRIINVNLETREIDLKNSPYREFLSINKDHYAETLFFKVPRYFDNVDFTKSDFLNTKLKDINFSTCNINNCNFDLHSIKGMVIDRMQSENIVELLGIKFDN